MAQSHSRPHSGSEAFEYAAFVTVSVAMLEPFLLTVISYGVNPNSIPTDNRRATTRDTVMTVSNGQIPHLRGQGVRGQGAEALPNSRPKPSRK